MYRRKEAVNPTEFAAWLALGEKANAERAARKEAFELAKHASNKKPGKKKPARGGLGVKQRFALDLLFGVSVGFVLSQYCGVTCSNVVEV